MKVKRGAREVQFNMRLYPQEYRRIVLATLRDKARRPTTWARRVLMEAASKTAA